MYHPLYLTLEPDGSIPGLFHLGHLHRIWPIPGLCRYSSSTCSLLKSRGCHKKTAASRSKEGIISHSLALVNSLKILLSVIWIVCPSLCFFVEERDWKLEKVQEPLLAQLQSWNMQRCMKRCGGNCVCLENRKINGILTVAFNYPRWSFWEIIKSFFFLGGVRILLLAVFEDRSDIFFLIVLRNLP